MSYDRVGRSTVSEITSEFSEAIWNCLNKKYIRFPSSNEEWEAISSDYERTWNFPHCVGSLDGKHARIVVPKITGISFYNYKSFYNMAMLVICDAKYMFACDSWRIW